MVLATSVIIYKIHKRLKKMEKKIKNIENIVKKKDN